ncbi:MAG: LytTR family DNA-binding domain-containing protein [Lachnospiraceae bacterium]|nr:LytTR family DNA-binding domain-containing protein [Lachnospiraceae bacterium]
MLPIYLCEDVVNQLIYLEKLISNYILMEELDMKVVCMATNPHEVLKVQKEFNYSGLYFLDIELNSDIDGFQLAEKIRKKDPRGYIVFITTYGELSYITFERHVEAMDYILKDYPDQIPSRVIACMKKALSLHSSVENRVQKTLSLKIGSRCIYVPVQEIYCIKSAVSGHKLLLQTDYSIYEFYGTLQSVILRLDTSFLLCHKSCIVNLHYISEIDKFSHSIRLKNGQSCPLSARNYLMVKKRLKEYINQD